MAGHRERRDQPARVIGSFDSVALVVGSMLGIGIFLSPPLVASHVGSPWVFFALWLFGGLISLAGAVACAELGTMMPRAGGDYVFQYEAYGPSLAFASGSILFAAIFSGSIATMTVALCEYQLPVLLGMDLTAPVSSALPLTGSQLAALGIIALLTGLNWAGALPSARTQAILTAVPIVVLGLGSVYALAAGTGELPPPEARQPPPALSMGGVVTSYMAVYFAYSGWINIIYVAGEVRRPARNIPLALIGGTLVVTALYVLLCAGFVRVLGMDGLRAAGEAGSAMAGLLAGETGRVAMTLVIASALMASINSTVLGGARIAYAMGQKGALWAFLGRLHPRTRAPARALGLQAAIAAALVISGEFEQLYTMVSVAMVITGAFTVGALFVLRSTRPAETRPYRANAYPLLPLVYILASLLTVGIMLYEAASGGDGGWYPLLGLGIFVLAYAGHRLWSARPPARDA